MPPVQSEPPADENDTHPTHEEHQYATAHAALKAEFREAIREELQTMYDAIWNHDLEADIEAAIQSLRRTGAFVPSPNTTHC